MTAQTVRTIRDVSYGLLLQCCFTSAQTVQIIRDGEPTTSTSTFTHLLSSLRSLHVHRDRTECQGLGAHAVHLMLCLSPRVFFCSATLRPRRPYGLLGNGAQDVHLDFQSAREGSVLLLPSTTSIFNVRFGCWTRWRSRRMTFSARNDHIT